MARAAMSACGLSEVWFLVNPEPGHKVGVTPLRGRVAMLRLAVEGLPGLSVYNGDLAGKAHTIDVFITLINQHLSDDFVFIVGADVLEHLPQWENSERVIERARFAVARRPRDMEVELDGRLRVQWFELEEHTAASSRDIREQLRAGKRPIELDGRVYGYISERGLYR